MRRPLHQLPDDPPEPPATVEEWACAIADLTALDGGEIEVSELLAIADRFIAAGSCPFTRDELDAALDQELRERGQ